MKYLLDTQVVIWFFQEDSRLGIKTQKFIRDRYADIAVSHVAIWEVAIKTSIGKLRMNRSIESYVNEVSLELLPIMSTHFKPIAELPFIHRDPFDRMLIAQAMAEDLTLVTGDADILKYPNVKLLNARK